MNTDQRWLYFGCGRGPGHYVFDERGNKVHTAYGTPLERLNRFDGMLPPQPEKNDQLYQATMSRLGGHGFSALAWWDRSEDKRGACNSVIFAPDMTIEPEAMLAQAKERFPWVFSRTPQPVALIRAEPEQKAAAA